MEKLSIIGKRVPRVDAIEKVTGGAKYSVDVQLPKMLYGKILRSPYPHARILNIDTSKAEKLPGIKAVVTAEDTPKIKYGWYIMDQLVLASDKVRYIGDEVAAVAAVDEDVAEEALDLIEVEYEKLPAVFDSEEAMKPGAPAIHEVEGNIVSEVDIMRGDIEKGFSEADYIFENKFITSSVHQCYLEPVACVASFDFSGKLTLWTTSMFPSGLRLSLAKVLNMTESKVRVVQTSAGGAFGGKCSMLQVYPICSLLSRKAGRPVKIANTREEEFTTTRPRLAAVIQQQMGVRKDGTIVAKQVEIIANTGAYANFGPLITTKMNFRTDSLYRIPNVKAKSKCVYTNKTPVGAFRGFGIPQMIFALESQMDEIAEKLCMDPMELRLKNVTKTGDITIHGWVINSCGLSECIQSAADSINWKEKRTMRQPNQGIGMACTIYVSDVRESDDFGGSTAFVKILEDGKVNIISGEAEYGQGVKTVFAQIAAEELGVPLEDIQIQAPDTDITPYTLGPLGDRITISGGNAVKLAAADAKRQLFIIASGMLEANVEDLDVKDRNIFVRGVSEKVVSISDVSRSSLYSRGGSAIVGKGVDERSTVLRDPKTMYGNESSAYTFAAQIAEVEVDHKTGHVKLSNFIAAHDLGKALNPMAAEGQIEGALAQGMGYGLMEELSHEKGRILNPNFSSYQIPTVLDMPPVKAILVESIDPNGPFGAKGVGEAALIPTAPAIANAIYDAIGVRIKELPITPEKILKALEEKRE